MRKTWRYATAHVKTARRVRVLGLACVLLFILAGEAHARREQTFTYGFTRVWNTSVRLVRIDFGSPILEKDKESGYFLFEFTDGGKQHAGSIELIRQQQDAGVESVRVVVQISALPAYVEQNLLDRLGRKLSAEYGAPIGGKPVVTKSDASKNDAGAGEPAAPAGDPKRPTQTAPGRTGRVSESPKP